MCGRELACVFQAASDGAGEMPVRIRVSRPFKVRGVGGCRPPQTGRIPAVTARTDMPGVLGGEGEGGYSGSWRKLTIAAPALVREGIALQHAREGGSTDRDSEHKAFRNGTHETASLMEGSCVLSEGRQA
jgi:hypothetical protein